MIRREADYVMLAVLVLTYLLLLALVLVPNSASIRDLLGF